ncbi:hypothetical protein VTP01DRAFT_7491 [Rhizomucor pusillus]|uniref:uncharacterized protein n=1 Tax=Rhizomucor pusillus TaxID=4840 RepID=UPI0037422A8A
MTRWMQLALFAISAFPFFAQAQDQSEAEADECVAEPTEDYNMPFRVGSLFIILVTSAVGMFTPIILHRIQPYSQGSIRDWCLTIAKFFGTGVILATAFVHMLPEALENFSSPCLTEGWQSYGAFAGIFCMISSFALQLLEMGAAAHLRSLHKHDQTSEHTQTEKYPDNLEAGHCHSAGFLEQDQSLHSIGTLILELGIVMHSIIIGIALANTGNDEFVTLLIALVFHQFFEGVALGTRVNDMNHKSWVKPVILGLLFVIMTPLGIAIGICIHSSYNGNSYSAVLSSAILDSLSAGILLYNAYISLMSAEVNHSRTFQQYSFIRKLSCFAAMYVGAGLMSLLGKWA